MFFNTFVWHGEEHNLYHIKLQQLGVDKTSYIAPLNIVKRLGKCQGEMCQSCKVNHVCLTTSCFNLSYLKPPSIHLASKRCFVIIKVQVPHNLLSLWVLAQLQHQGKCELRSLCLVPSRPELCPAVLTSLEATYDFNFHRISHNWDLYVAPQAESTGGHWPCFHETKHNKFTVFSNVEFVVDPRDIEAWDGQV